MEESVVEVESSRKMGSKGSECSKEERRKMLLIKAKLYLTLKGKKEEGDINTISYFLCRNVCKALKDGYLKCEKHSKPRLWTDGKFTRWYYGYMKDLKAEYIQKGKCYFCIEWAKHLWEGEKGEHG